MIHPDQSGFIPTCSTVPNIRWLVHILHSPLRDYPKATILAVDIEKALSFISFDFLYIAMASVSLGSSFLSRTKLPCTFPTACSRTGRFILDNCSIERGTRKGYPLSLVLFAMAIETLTSTLTLGCTWVAFYVTLRYIQMICCYISVGSVQRYRGLAEFAEVLVLCVNWGILVFLVTPVSKDRPSKLGEERISIGCPTTFVTWGCKTIALKPK